jgi:hypothetical protein
MQILQVSSSGRTAARGARYFASLFINSGLDEISRAVSMVMVDSPAHSTIPLGWGTR